MSLWEAVIFTVISVTGLVTNGGTTVILYRFLRQQKMQRGTCKFLINQSVLDALAAFLLLTSYFHIQLYGAEITFPMKFTVWGDFVCKFYCSDRLLYGFLVASTHNLVGLTLDRYLKVVHPIWHKTKFTDRMQTGMMVFPWLFGPIWCTAAFIVSSKVMFGRCITLAFWPQPSHGRVAGVLTSLVAFFIPLGILLACYVKIYLSIRKEVEPLQSSTETDEAQPSGSGTATQSSSRKDQASATAKDDQVSNLDLRLPLPIDSTKKKVTHKKSKSAQEIKLERNILKTLVLVCVGFFLCYVTNQVRDPVAALQMYAGRVGCLETIVLPQDCLKTVKCCLIMFTRQ